ncbi:MAG: Fic family protein [Parafannyhessea sp.]|uniref:Fic family protein n=1 Tax=Parafannyhessea sp. TaxID=2847324 RepID=UPI003F0D6270
MAYKSLMKLFYMDASSDRFANNDRLAAERLGAESTFRTGMQAATGELFIALPHELSVLSEQVLRKERIVQSLQAAIPPIARGALVRSLVIDEVVGTNDLEGIRSTRKQINELLESASAAEHVGQKRFRELAKLYLGLSGGNAVPPQSPEDIRAIYDQVMAGEDLGKNAPDGRLFRRSGVEVIGKSGDPIHEGAKTEAEIVAGLGSLLAFASSPDVPQLYSAIASHFMFEYIHPFYDGNGRTGRYLLALYLSEPLSELTSLSLSREIAENRSPYYKAFQDAEAPMNHGELTPFVIQMLEYVSSAQDRLIADLGEKSQRLGECHDLLGRAGSDLALTERESELLYLLVQHDLFAAFPSIQLEEATAYMRMGRQSTRKHLGSLVEKGLVNQVGGRPLRFELSADGRRLLEG